MKHCTIFNSLVGDLALICDHNHLTNIYFENQFQYIENIAKKETSTLTKTKVWLQSYFEGKNPCAKTLDLFPTGTDFQKVVWGLLATIPYGKTVTYKDLANSTCGILNKEEMSAQAIGRAVSKNPIPIILPCHRVIGSNGKLVGFSGGVEKKIKLLEIEGINLNKLG